MSLPLAGDRTRLLVHRTVLPNGLVVLATENPTADIIAARIFVRVGTRYEAAEQAGITHLLTAVMTKGTDRLSSMEIAEQVESVGASLSADSATDYSILSLKTVSRDFPEMLALAAELLRSPSFPVAEVDLERRLTLQGLRSMQEQPFNVAQKQLRQGMYRKHPYALSSLGTETSISALQRDDLHRYHQTYFRPDNMVISIAGRITAEAAIALVQQTFGDWRNPETEAPPIAPQLPALQPQPHVIATAQETQQAIVMLGYFGPSIHSPDYTTLRLINTYLGNGLSSRLFVELREKQGLAYDVSTIFPTRIAPSQFMAYIGTAPGNVSVALEGLQREINYLRDNPLSPEELQVAKDKYLGQYALGKQTNAQIAQIYGWYEILGAGIDFDQHFQTAFLQVTAEAVQEAANRYFIEPYVSLVGPEEAIAQA